MNIFFNNKIIFASKSIVQTNIFFDVSKKVVDELRGYLMNVFGNWEFVGVAQYKSLKKKNRPIKMAIVLESPHKNEISSNNIPLRPANGTTGRNINNLLGEVIDKENNTLKLDIGKVYSVYLMNVIQYQCSLYHYNPSYKKLKIDIFNAFFNNANGRNDFITRLKTYKPKFVINACTKELRQDAEDAIKAALGKPSNIQTAHPSYWSIKYK